MIVMQIVRLLGCQERGRFERFEHNGKSKTVLRTGSGPAVIVMSEIPGITPRVAEFGRKVSGIGCTAVLPSLFGVPGEK